MNITKLQDEYKELNKKVKSNCTNPNGDNDNCSGCQCQFIHDEKINISNLLKSNLKDIISFLEVAKTFDPNADNYDQSRLNKSITDKKESLKKFDLRLDVYRNEKDQIKSLLK